MTSLDKLFDETRIWLQCIQIPLSSNSDSIHISSDQRLALLDHELRQDDHNSQRYRVVDHMLDLVERIQVAVQNVPKSGELISISLPDMKTFNMLVTFIVIEGIYAGLSPGVGIPLEFRSKKLGKLDVKQNPIFERPVLELVVSRLIPILKVKGDVRDLILLGSHSTDLICAAAEVTFHPCYLDTTQNKEPKNFNSYDFILEQIDTYSLYTYLTALLRPGSPNWFTSCISRSLALLPISRSNGVRSLIEFVVGSRENENISLNKIDKAIRILKTVPRGMTIDEYSYKLGKQFVIILGDTKTRSVDIVLAAMHVLSALYQQRKEIVSGFEICLQEILNPSYSETGFLSNISDTQIEMALGALNTVVKDASQPELITSIAIKIIAGIWCLYSYLKKSKRPSESVKTLIVSLINTSDQSHDMFGGDSLVVIEELVRSLLQDGGTQWIFGPGQADGVEIRKRPSQLIETPGDAIYDMEKRIEYFMGIVSQLSESIVSMLFVSILSRWLHSRNVSEDDIFSNTNPFSLLADVQLIKEISEKEKSKLFKSSFEIIKLISGLLNEYTLALEARLKDTCKSKDKIDANVGLESLKSIILPDSDDEEEEEEDNSDDDSDEDAIEIMEQKDMLKLSLSLISSLIIEEVSEKDMELLQSIVPQLQYIIENDDSPIIVEKATMTLEALKQPGKIFTENSKDSEQIYRKAIASLDDGIIPIRAYGINLLRGLINKHEPVIKLKPVMKILLSHLRDDDSFIYLNSIKALDELTKMFKPESTIMVFLGVYIDHGQDIDFRLRVGEVLLRIVQDQGQVFKNQVSETIAESLIGVISTRNNNNGLNVEDDRMRMSALSVLGALCEINPFGVGRWMSDTVDCAIGVLTFERTPQKVIMRRSAIVLVASLLKKLTPTKSFPREYIFTLRSRIEYVELNDDDPLVRVQAETALQIFDQKFTIISNS